jgi:hypothetical protein
MHQVRYHRISGNLSSRGVFHEIYITLFAAISAKATTQVFFLIVTSHRIVLRFHQHVSKEDIHHDLRILTLKPYGCVEFPPKSDANRLSRNKIIDKLCEKRIRRAGYSSPSSEV